MRFYFDSFKNSKSIVWMCLVLFSCFNDSHADSVWVTHLNSGTTKGVSEFTSEYKNLSSAIKSKTSIEMSDKLQEFYLPKFAQPSFPEQGWVFANMFTISKILDTSSSLSSYFSQWLRQGGFLVLEEDVERNSKEESLMERLAERISYRSDVRARWREVPVEHELMRSFFLHTSFPSCKNRMWKVLEYDQRTVGVYAPFPWMEWLKDRNWSNVPELSKRVCEQSMDADFLSKIFVNMVMTALTTDYKMDQIHLPEILKRLQ